CSHSRKVCVQRLQLVNDRNTIGHVQRLVEVQHRNELHVVSRPHQTVVDGSMDAHSEQSRVGITMEISLVT
ncbi:hypothetical protein PFISCL1PPCAC_23778, partial [Pristionchus fissidentatus]